jgi:hypothetical protein
VNMTRTDLAFAYSQLSKFVQYPGVVHLQAAERVLQYVSGTYDQGITYCDLGAEVVVLMIKELLMVTLELKSRTN